MRNVNGVQLVELGKTVFGYLSDVVVRSIQDTQTRHILNGNLSQVSQEIITQLEGGGKGGLIEAAP